MNASLYPPLTGRLSLSRLACLKSESCQSIFPKTRSGWEIEIRERPKNWIALSNTPDAFDTGIMLSTCCIIFLPLSLAETAWFQFVAFLSRTNNVDLSKRIIALEPDFVHAVIRIGSLDFQKGTQ